jgi:hypothetical protein
LELNHLTLNPSTFAFLSPGKLVKKKEEQKKKKKENIPSYLVKGSGGRGAQKMQN